MNELDASKRLSWLCRLTAAALLLLATVAQASQAAVGYAELPRARGDGPVTMFYPTRSDEAPIERGPFRMSFAVQGEAVRGNGRLVVLSHGSGGSPWVHSDLARALVGAGFIVAMPEHRGDNHKDHGTPGPESWKLRPAEVSRAIDAVAQDSRFAALLSFDKVGVYGMSAGGHTALSLAGGRWSTAGFRDHCAAHIADDFPACAGLATSLTGGAFDATKKWLAIRLINQRFDDAAWQMHTDPRVAAIVASVPYAADFEMASLAAPRVPLGLVTAGQDRWLAPAFHSDAVLKACAPCERVAELPTAGHGALLSPAPPAAVLGKAAAALLADPPGFDRRVLAAVDQRIVAFFARHLLP